MFILHRTKAANTESKPAHDKIRSEMTDKRVYYNDEEMKYVEVRFRSAEYGKGESGLENYFMEYPNMIETEGMEAATDITQVKIYETNHFFEVKFFNEEDEMLTIHKIPYELVTEVNIESKKCKDLKIPMTELSKSKNYPNEKAALEEYRNCIREIMGDESIDMIISELKKEVRFYNHLNQIMKR